MGFFDDVIKMDARLEQFESDEKMINDARNRRIANGVYDDFDKDDDFGDFGDFDDFSEHDDFGDLDDFGEHDDLGKHDDEDDILDNDEEENEYNLECIEMKANPSPEETEFYLTHYEDEDPTYSKFLGTNYPQDDWTKKEPMSLG